MKRGVTTVEILITLGIFLIIIPLVHWMFKLVQQSVSVIEARNALNAESQKSLNIMVTSLGQCKRIIDRSIEADVMAAFIQTQLDKPIISGSMLPLIVPTASISPSSTTMRPDSVGNSLLLAVIDRSIEIQKGALVTDTARLDVFHFEYYFLSEKDGAAILDRAQRELRQWRSAQYVSRDQLLGVPLADRDTLFDNLNAAGFNTCWDSAALNPGLFYTIDKNAPNVTDPAPGHPLRMDSKPMIKIVTGITAGGYRYGVSPNETSAPPETMVPRFAIANGEFPSGFEVVIVGPNGARQIFLRLVLAAQGSFSGAVRQQQTVLASARDIW